MDAFLEGDGILLVVAGVLLNNQLAMNPLIIHGDGYNLAKMRAGTYPAVMPM